MVVRLLLLRLINPASAYMHQVERHQHPAQGRSRRGTAQQRGQGWALYGPRRAARPGLLPAAPPPREEPSGSSDWAESQRVLDDAHRGETQRGADELLRDGVASISTRAGIVTARLVRFWNGTAVATCAMYRSDGSRAITATLLDRRTLRERAAIVLAGTLWGAICDLGRPDGWEPPPVVRERVLSPGGWTPPAGVRPMWNWTPPSGGTPRLDLAPAWVRVWYRTPFLDRYAHSWMWRHGMWEVSPPDKPSTSDGGESGVREPRRPRPPAGADAIRLDEPGTA
jgi:hypothetical protein